MLPGWHRLFTVNGEFLGLHNLDSGNGCLVLSQDSIAGQYINNTGKCRLLSSHAGHKNRPHL